MCETIELTFLDNKITDQNDFYGTEIIRVAAVFKCILNVFEIEKKINPVFKTVATSRFQTTKSTLASICSSKVSISVSVLNFCLFISLAHF